MANRVGGLKEDVPAGWTDRVRRARRRPCARTCRRRSSVAPGQRRAEPRPTRRRTGSAGRSAAPPGWTSTCAGTSRTWRTGELVVPVVTRTAGDARARYECLHDQVPVALDLADAVLDRLPALSGPVNVRLPKTVKAPEGAVYEWTENPLGINGYYLVSRGERTPVAAEAALRLVQQRAGAEGAAAGDAGRGPGHGPRLNLLRGRRHRPLRPAGTYRRAVSSSWVRRIACSTSVISVCLVDSRDRASVWMTGVCPADRERLPDVLDRVGEDPVEPVHRDDERQPAGLEEVDRREAVGQPPGVDQHHRADRAAAPGRPT